MRFCLAPTSSSPSQMSRGKLERLWTSSSGTDPPLGDLRDLRQLLLQHLGQASDADLSFRRRQEQGNELEPLPGLGGAPAQAGQKSVQ